MSGPTRQMKAKSRATCRAQARLERKQITERVTEEVLLRVKLGLLLDDPDVIREESRKIVEMVFQLRAHHTEGSSL